MLRMSIKTAIVVVQDGREPATLAFTGHAARLAALGCSC